MQRFFLNPEDFEKEKIRISNPSFIHQITCVLRIKLGEKIVVLDNTGFEYLIEITSISPREIQGKILEKKKNQAEPELKIALYQAVPKQVSKFELVLQKGTELGVSVFYPLVTARTEIPFLPKRIRMEKIIKEAAEQSGRGILPLLEPEVKFKEVLKNPPAGFNLLASPQKNKILLKDIKAKISGARLPINIFIGPEGGFTEEENKRAQKAQFEIFGLGPRIFRTETAGLVILSVLLFS